jgi:adenosylcobinamide-phosphate synthase
MSALAGALNVRLEKPGYYVLNANARNPKPHDIVRGVKLTLTLATLYTVIIAMVIAIVDLL